MTAVAVPGEDAYAHATEVFNLANPPRPVAALTARTVEDVATALAFAREGGLPVRVHTTGHAAGAARPMNGSLLIRTELAGGVEIDTARRLARIPAGTRWGAVVDAATPHGLTAVHGSAASVGVVGYLLGGGLSFYGRQHGLGVNSVRAIELVIADGTPIRVDADTDAELFWAVRGGGGGFGVVTAVEVELFPVTMVMTGAAYFPAEHAEALLRTWLTWTRDAPPEVSTSLRFMNLPAAPNVPDVLAGVSTVCVDGAALDAAAAQDLLGALRSVAGPVLDTWAETGAAAVLDAHMDPDRPMPVVGDHLLLDELDDAALTQLLRVLGPGSGSPLIAAGFRQLGGAYATSVPHGGVLDHVTARFSYAGSGVPMGGVTGAELRERCDLVRASLAPWDTGSTLPSFVEHFGQPQRHLGPASIVAIDRVRGQVDPAGFFRGDIAPGATALS